MEEQEFMQAGSPAAKSYQGFSPTDRPTTTAYQESTPTVIPATMSEPGKTPTGRVKKGLKGERVYVCYYPECGKTYTRLDHLRRHQDREGHGFYGGQPITSYNSGSGSGYGSGYAQHSSSSGQSYSLSGQDLSSQGSHDPNDYNPLSIQGFYQSYQGSHDPNDYDPLESSSYIPSQDYPQASPALYQSAPSYSYNPSLIQTSKNLLTISPQDCNQSSLSKTINRTSQLSHLPLQGKTVSLLKRTSPGIHDRSMLPNPSYSGPHPVDEVVKSKSPLSSTKQTTQPGERIDITDSDVDLQMKDFRHEFVDVIMNVSATPEVGSLWHESVPDILPELLKTFALKLGQCAKEANHYDTMFFILKNRNEISQILQERWQEYARNTFQARNQEMSSEARARTRHYLQERCSSSKPANETYSSEKMRADKAQAEPGQSSQIAGIQYADLTFATSGTACEWLIAQLINLSVLSFPADHTMQEIKRNVAECFPYPHMITRKTPHVLHTITFHLDWDVNGFFNNHLLGSNEDYEDKVSTFLTLTSDGNDIQALTSSQYLRQTWPVSGELFLTLIADLLGKGQGTINTLESTIDACISRSQVLVKVIGTSHAITEIAEQLAWFGAVFRASPTNGVTSYCVPVVKAVARISQEWISGWVIEDMPKTYEWTISFKMHELPLTNQPGNCWQSLFRYPVVAHGFPVRKRDQSIKGLEMSLGVMLSLCQADHVTRFKNHIVIKGFSSMLCVSESQPGSSIWHFTGDMDGTYISYSSATNAADCQELDMEEIMQNRHFVGWCLKSTYGVGALNSNYAIQTSGLLRPLTTGLLYGKSLRRGYRHPKETVWIADDKRSPRPTSHQIYFERLNWLHSRPMVLWDTVDRRGWLTNGTSGLLHLFLASLECYGEPFSSAYCLRREDLIVPEKDTEKSALRILLDEQNLKLAILSHNGETVSLKDRIEDIYILINMAIDLQITAMQTNDRPLSLLEGWNFIDMANKAHDPLHPRLFVLDKDCCGWMSLLRDTCAVTLFGQNFGELFSPIDLRSCPHWAALPTQNCYLAANMKDLESISKTYGGGTETIPWRLTEHTIWPVLKHTFDECSCSSGYKEHTELVQVLLPSSVHMDEIHASKLMQNPPSAATVIFGQFNNSFGFQSRHTTSSCGISSRKRQRTEADSQVCDNHIKEGINPTLIGRKKSPGCEEYLVAIFCAKPNEFRAVRRLYDEEYEAPVYDENDPNLYAFGSICYHKVVAASLPGTYGTCSAAHVASELQRSFPKVKIRLLVGVGGGIPSDVDIRLGDVVVSRPGHNHPGIIKYDFEKLGHNGEVKRLGQCKQPPRELLSAMNLLDTSKNNSSIVLEDYLQDIIKNCPDYAYPGELSDVLYAAEYPHDVTTGPCSNCNGPVIERAPRSSTNPRIHYGLIASADKVIKDAQTRDLIGSKYNALCVEMEAAGIATDLSILVIRGICDYADSHKQKIWQNYASATAAAYAKLLLGILRPLKET